MVRHGSSITKTCGKGWSISTGECIGERIGRNRQGEYIWRNQMDGNGKWSPTTIGTPQGAIISPVLANVYLHYALDLWAHQWRRKLAGEMFIVRYADDVIFAFQYKNDAERFRAALAERLRQFGLELH